MHIFIFIHSLFSGGAERVAATLAHHWAEQGWTVTMVTLASSTLDFYDIHPSVRRIALNQADKSRNPIAAIVNNLQRSITLRRILRTTKPDIALGIMTTANVLLCLSAAGLRGIAVIGSERIYPPRWPLGRLWEQLRRWTYPSADRIVMLTNEGLHWLGREIPKAYGVVIPNPVRYPLPITAPRLAPGAWVNSDRKLLLAVGRLNEQKRFDRLLQAFAKLAPENAAWDLVILGEGELRSELEQQARTLGLTTRAHLPGRAGNIGDWYARADLYVMSSHFEGFPNALGEAMAHGCAAVSFDCDTGPRDIIRHEVDGLLAPAGDVARLATALGRLMRDDGLRLRMAGRAIEARERFSLEKIAEIWKTMFVEVKQ